MKDELEAMKARLEWLDGADGSIVASGATTAQNGTETIGSVTIDSLTWNWDRFVWGPIELTKMTVIFYRTGDWKTSATLYDLSESSDWDVWVDLWVLSKNTNGFAFTIMDNAWFQDIDHDDPAYDKKASGNSYYVRSYWDDFVSGIYEPNFTVHRKQD